jgi:superoxide dismutase, Fe-Mn family
MPKYTLPDLPYDYGALEPHVSGRIMELHHDKHHATYVEGANSVLERLDAARDRHDLKTQAAGLEKALAFNLSGHVLHSLFWQNLVPKGGDRPDGALAETIARDFGSFDGFKTQLTEAASTIMGSGWAALVWEPLGERLLTVQIHDHQADVTQAGLPLLVLDAWEHAYYLQYENRKADFFKAIWNCWNWKDVSDRFEAARRADRVLAGAATSPRESQPQGAKRPQSSPRR